MSSSITFPASLHHSETTYNFFLLDMQISLPFFATIIALELLYAMSKLRSKKLTEKKREGVFARSLGIYRMNDTFSSLACGITDQLISKLLSGYLNLIVYCATFHYFRIFTLSNNSWWAWWLAFFMKDHQYYWFHRFVHETYVGWASHSAHHSSEEYNLVTALRQGCIQGFFSPVFYTPMALVGISPELYSWHNSLNLMYQFWIHTKAINKFPRIIELVFNTPSHHRVHHARNREYIDMNYGGVLIIFDRLYGTFAEEKQEPVYGLVTPIESFNPIYTQTHSYVELIQKARNCPTIYQKLQVVFRSPSFDPLTQTMYELPEAPKQPALKFDPAIPSSVKWYASIHFFATVVWSFMFILDEQPTTLSQQWIQAAFLLFSLSCQGCMFDGQLNLGFAVESIRLTMMALIHLFRQHVFMSLLFPQSILKSSKWTIGISVASILSLVYLVNIHRGTVNKKAV